MTHESPAQEKFRSALREAMLLDCEQCIPLTEPHTFSPQFEKKMNALIRRREKPYYRLISTAGRRAACAAAAVLVLSTVSVMRVDALRSAFQHFTVQMRAVFSTVTPTDQGSVPDTILSVYEVTYPFDDGFHIEHEYNSSDLRTIIYQNGDTAVFFNQYTKNAFHTAVNTENAELIPLTIHGTEAIFFLDNLGAYHLIWDDGEYILYLLGNVDKDTFLDIAESVKKAE